MHLPTCLTIHLPIYIRINKCVHIHIYIYVCTYLPGCWQVLSPTRKETSYSDQTLTSASHSKQFRRLSVQPGLRASNNIRVGRKMATFQLFYKSGRAKDLSAPLRMHRCFSLQTTRFLFWKMILSIRKSFSMSVRTSAILCCFLLYFPFSLWHF